MANLMGLFGPMGAPDAIVVFAVIAGVYLLVRLIRALETGPRSGSK